MLTPSEISLFSLKKQRELLKKHGLFVVNIIQEKGLILEIYELGNCFFHVYLCERDKLVKKVVPLSHNVLI